MSRKLNLSNLNISQRQKLSQELTITVLPTKYSKQMTYIHPFDVDDQNNIYVPFAYDTKIQRPQRKNLSVMDVKFEGKLREIQEEVYSQCIRQLNKRGSSLLALYTGFGKTAMAIYISCKIKLKTLIIVNRVVLANQWKSSIKQFCPEARVQILAGKTKKEDNDFYIMNAINIAKRPHGDYEDMLNVCVDECHLILADKLSKCMCCLNPRYLLGLSATPYRQDGLDVLFDLYFGPEKIVRKMYRKHDVWVVQTGIRPTMELTEAGKVNWNSLLDSISTNTKRNEMIIKLTRHFPQKVLLILTKRVEQAKYFVRRLTEEGENVDYLTGSKQEFDRKCRILVGTTGKCSVGFDFVALDGLILAADIESYFLQVLGRVFRRKDNIPVIFDIVDDNPIL